MVNMKKGQSGMICECHGFGITDTDNILPVSITLIGMSEDRNNVTSFVIVLRDDSLLKKQQEEAQNAKEMSEKLLYQILPRDIVNKLNSGEKEISFSVPHASIIFIDIVKFSEYSAHVSHSKIMETLSLVFSTFDKICSKYNLITKIKLIGDIYMAASGLFSQDNNPSSHAEQMIRFALDVLSSMDDINAQLCSSLVLRIGINTDGPIICGVFGTDKPIFDIIGDPINVASRLQSTGIPGTIQISQKTFDSVRHLEFDMEQRGEIQVKGKGNMITYIVKPSYLNELTFHDIAHSSGSTDIPFHMRNNM